MMERNNMKISVENYGPIAEAKNIELCPLTVFVGPSNTGKSYLAVLIYALLKPFEERSRRTRILGFDTVSTDESIDKFPTELFKEDNENFNFSDFPEKFKKWIIREIGEETNKIFHQEISRCMGASSTKNHPISKEFNLNLEINQQRLILGASGIPPSMDIKELEFSNKHFTGLVRRLGREKEIPKNIRAMLFLEKIADYIFHPRSETESFYLPAARTGIMQSHRAIAGALVRRSTFAGLETFSVPTLSGIVSDFLEEIILMDTNEVDEVDEVAEVADEMEKNILHGSIQSESSESNQYPEFTYKQNGFEVPLLRSSSMVSELAPVVLFIRHRVGKGDLLIIEEPESHLHPEAQRGIAKTIVRLVRSGVRVVVTTHSDYFLEQLGNHVRLSKLTKAQRGKFPDSQNLFLEENEIGAYVFNQQEKGGTVVERLNFDQENGLSPDDHNTVSSNLYNETADILDVIEDKK